jgi:hypothetical protein
VFHLFDLLKNNVITNSMFLFLPVIGFILPAIFSYKFRGYTHVGALLFVVGGTIGCVGTFLSLAQLVKDSRADS